jgi:hypothetical protein
MFVCVCVCVLLSSHCCALPRLFPLCSFALTARVQGDHIDLEFTVQFYPMDVTQVMQYVTLYQVRGPACCMVFLFVKTVNF